MTKRFTAGAAFAALTLLTVNQAAARVGSAPPWSRPLAFHALAGWQTGMSGTVHNFRNGAGRLFRLHYAESSAWISNLRYRDHTTSDPPQHTHLGSAPTPTMLRQARRALRALALPRPRR